MIVVKFWNACDPAWHVFGAYGLAYENDAIEVARKLQKLFSAVEVWKDVPGKDLELILL